MPPFRIAARHPDKDHADHAWHQIGGLFDAAEDAQHVIDEDTQPPDPTSVPAEQRVVRDATVVTTERTNLGYEMRVEELVPDKTGKDDNGMEIVLEHKWKAV